MNQRDGCSHSFQLQFSSISRFFISILKEKNIFVIKNENSTFHSPHSVCSKGGVGTSYWIESLAHWVAPFITTGIHINEANLYVSITSL